MSFCTKTFKKLNFSVCLSKSFISKENRCRCWYSVIEDFFSGSLSPSVRNLIEKCLHFAFVLTCERIREKNSENEKKTRKMSREKRTKMILLQTAAVSGTYSCVVLEVSATHYHTYSYNSIAFISTYFRFFRCLFNTLLFVF